MPKEDHLENDAGPEDHSGMADEYPSPEASDVHLADPMDMSSQLANQAAAQAQAQAHAQAQAQAQARLQAQALASSTSSPAHVTNQDQQQAEPSTSTSPRHAVPTLSRISRHQQPLATNADQIRLLREFYTKNPNPDRRDLEFLAERTGRPYVKVREYFRQRRNKLRGLGELESKEEPGRASGWLQVTYRSGPPQSQVSQLSLYSAYKTRFDPFSSTSPLLGGQDLIELVCATFPGCEMSKAGEEYYLSGLKERDGGEAELEKILEGVAEPVRASTWLLSNYQQSADATPIPQTDLYTSYALRFSAPPADDSPAAEDGPGSLQQADDFDLAQFDEQHPTEDGIDLPPAPPRRLLSPVELITLTRLTFPHCEPAVDGDGKFVIRGVERRDAVEKGWIDRSGDMFPFALMTEPRPSDPDHPFTKLLKRKLSSLHPDPPAQGDKRPRNDSTTAGLGSEEKELLNGLRRFKDSELGKEVKEVCVNQ